MKINSCASQIIPSRFLFCQFLHDVSAQYQIAGQPFKSHLKLHRGEARSVSGIAEDLLASEIAAHFWKFDKIYINQPMMITTSGGLKFSRKPDLALCVDNEIVGFIDLKMDLGYQRAHIGSHIDSSAEWIQKARGQTVRIRVNRVQHSLQISKVVRYYYLVVSGLNISPVLLTQNFYCKLWKNRKFVRGTVILKGFHPNTKGGPLTFCGQQDVMNSSRRFGNFLNSL